MNMNLFPGVDFCFRLTATLLHFLWQGAVVALLALAASVALRRASAGVRYHVLVAALALMAVCPVATFVVLGGASLPGSTPPVEELVARDAPRFEANMRSRGAPSPAPVDADADASDAASQDGLPGRIAKAFVVGAATESADNVRFSAPDGAAKSEELAVAGDSSAPGPAQPPAGSAASTAETPSSSPVPEASPESAHVAATSAEAPRVNGAIPARVADLVQRLRTTFSPWFERLSPAMARRAAPWVSIAYFTGIALMLARLLVALRGGGRLRLGAEPVTNGAVLEALDRATHALHLRAAPAVAWCHRVVTPTLVGIVKPTILLPLSLTSGLTPDQIEMLLLHELAHVRRRDPWVNFTQWVIETALFFHPAVWWVSGRIRREREIACDDLAVAAGAPRERYAESLVRVAELSRDARDIAAAAFSLGSRGGRRSNLAPRVLRLLGDGEAFEQVRPARLWPLAGMLVVAVGLTAWVAFTAACSRPDSEKKPVADEAELKHGFGDQQAPSPSPTPTFAPAVAGAVGIRLRPIPAGSFLMGSPAGEQGRGKDETQHEVVLTEPFYMGITEVTQAQFQEVMGHNPSKWKDSRLPVESVIWQDANDFCRRLSELDPRFDYRLPTEAEWEYACRAGTTTRFHWGDDENLAERYAFFGQMANKGGNSGNRTNPVGWKLPNPWGLHDMSGNVFEWCADWYGGYPSTKQVDPQGAPPGERRIKRGGSWEGSSNSCCSASRSPQAPSLGNPGIGFRVVAEPTAEFETAASEEPLLGAIRPVPRITIPGNLRLDLDPADLPPSGIPGPVEGMRLRLMPAGRFLMGSPPDEEGRRDDETQHEVILTKPFYMSVYELTKGHRAYLKGEPLRGSDDMVRVSPVGWEDAEGLSFHANRLDPDLRYRPPTEAEWEYACRAGTTTRFFWGESSDPVDVHPFAVCGSTNSGWKGQFGSRLPNPWGLYDMSGSLSEWCSDYYGEYATGTVTDPKGPSTGTIRVFRGGDMEAAPFQIRSAARPFVNEAVVRYVQSGIWHGMSEADEHAVNAFNSRQGLRLVADPDPRANFEDRRAFWIDAWREAVERANGAANPGVHADFAARVETVLEEALPLFDGGACDDESLREPLAVALNAFLRDNAGFAAGETPEAVTARPARGLAYAVVFCMLEADRRHAEQSSSDAGDYDRILEAVSDQAILPNLRFVMGEEAWTAAQKHLRVVVDNFRLAARTRIAACRADFLCPFFRGAVPDDLVRDPMLIPGFQSHAGGLVGYPEYPGPGGEETFLSERLPEFLEQRLLPQLLADLAWYELQRRGEAADYWEEMHPGMLALPEFAAASEPGRWPLVFWLDTRTRPRFLEAAGEGGGTAASAAASATAPEAASAASMRRFEERPRLKEIVEMERQRLEEAVRQKKAQTTQPQSGSNASGD